MTESILSFLSKQLSHYHELLNMSHTLSLIFIYKYKRMMNNINCHITEDILREEKKEEGKEEGKDF
jgi:hypothetical protein